jgi:virulence factor Mce-like protein
VASPVLVGAVTVLVTVVAVFLAYNANSGLPFVPTYDLKAELPNAANLVEGNDVRIGGTRVGTVTKIEPIPHRDGTATAEVEMKLEKRVQPLPVDTTLIVRPRSALGLKYVELTPGDSKSGFRPGSTIALSQATPRPVEIDEVFNIFDERTREGSRRNLDYFGNALTGRGVDLNLAIEQLKPLLTNLEPVAENLAAGRTQIARFFQALRNTAGEVAPVAEQQASLFGNLDTTFAALSSVARPFIQDTISESPPTEQAGIEDFPRQRPFLRNATQFARDLRPGVRTLPATLPDLADALEFAVPNLRRLPSFNRRLEGVFHSIERLVDDPAVSPAIRRLNDTVSSLDPTLAFLTPVQTECNYVTLWFRNVSSLLSEGDANGTWQRFIIIATPIGPNSEGGPSSAPANGPEDDNHLHANPYPNTASPGQTDECEAANEPYLVGRTTIGNVPGNQGKTTSDQDRPTTQEGEEEEAEE